jgi:mannobiose 2-epimerase
MDPEPLRRAIASELESNLLPFWRVRAVDHESGGFIAEMAADGIVHRRAPRGLILASRLVWTFAALYRELGDGVDLELARRADAALESGFRDLEHGGYLWRVGADGRPLDRSKKIYGQAFCIYALSELRRATGDESILDRAKQLFHLVEDHAHDERFGGYVEARAMDWSEADGLRLSDKDMDAPKSMNTHLHLLEAFTNLHRVWPDPLVAERLDELFRLFGRRILNRDSDRRHLCHFFDHDWTPCSASRTYGHDIEAAWLLGEAAEELGDPRARELANTWAIELARSVLSEGVGPDGGLAFEGRDGAVINGDRDWWCQAEAVIGFWHVFALTGEPRFAEASASAWRFIERHLVDRVHGDWHWRIRADGTVDSSEPKVSAWKGPYHNVRLCLEMMRRLDGAGEEAP